MHKLLNLPLLWLIGMIGVAVVGAAEYPRQGAEYSLHDTYFVIAHAHYTLSLAVAFGVFAALYGSMERLLRLPYSRALGLAHFGMTLAGAALILCPVLLVPALGGSRRNVVETFDLMNAVSSIGYLLTLAGLVVFVVLIADTFRRRVSSSRR